MLTQPVKYNKGRTKRRTILEFYGERKLIEIRNGLKDGDLIQLSNAYNVSKVTLCKVLNGNSSRFDLLSILEKRSNENKAVSEPVLYYVGSDISVNEYRRFKTLFRSLQFNDTFKLYIVWKTGKEFKKVKTGIPYWFDSKCFEEFISFCGKRPKLVRGKLVFDSTDLVETVVTLEKEIERLKGLLSAFGL